MTCSPGVVEWRRHEEVTMAEIPNPQIDRSAERSFDERLAAARPVTAEDLDAMAIEDLTDEEWDRFWAALNA